MARRLGWRRSRWWLAAVGLTVVVAVPAVVAVTVNEAQAAGGTIVLGGDDLTDHGSRDVVAGVNVGGWRYLEKVLEAVSPGVTRDGNDGTVAALGSADSAATSGDAGAAIHYAAQDAGGGIEVSYHNGGVAIQQLFADIRAGFANPAIIWIAGDGALNDLGDDPSEPTALANNVATIADFVNSGGGLVSHGSGYGWLPRLLPGTTSVPSGGAGDLQVTLQGAWIQGLTNADVNAGHWHSHFEGGAGGLFPLVVSSTVDDSGGSDAWVVVGGSGVVLPHGSFTLSPSFRVIGVGSHVSVAARVLSDAGQPVEGTTVTFTIVSGPNQGDTGTGVTDANGVTSFTWLGDGGEGVDTLQASHGTVDGSTRTATAETHWTETPFIAIVPIQALPFVLAACAAVVVVHRRQRRGDVADGRGTIGG